MLIILVQFQIQTLMSAANSTHIQQTTPSKRCFKIQKY